MGRIGRKFAADIYPQSPNSGGGGANALVPLSRQRFIDGDTIQPGLNGSVANPYATIAQFTTARAANNTSILNATANFVGWVMPSDTGYVESVAFPPYASTELRADSVSVVAGTLVTGNVTWANIAGPFVAVSAVVSMHNISVSGNITLTDDVGAPTSFFIFSGDETGDSSPVIGGNFVSSTTQNLFSVNFSNVTVSGNIDTGNLATSAIITLYESVVIGDITTRFLFAQDSTIFSDEITCSSATQSSQFFNCTFTGPTDLNCVAAPTGAIFDGPSWNSFLSQGGTRDPGTTILVIGGYSVGSIEGAALTGAATSVSLNGVGATAGYTLENSGNHYSTSNGTPTSVTLLTGGGELPGDTICITKTDLGANAIAVINGGVGAGTIGTIPANERGFVVGKFNGTNWIFFEGGSLAP